MTDREIDRAASIVRGTPIHLNADALPRLPWEDAAEDEPAPPWWEPYVNAVLVWALIGALCLAAVTLAHILPR